MDKSYRRLIVSCDCSYTTVAECLAKMLPADAYVIHAGRLSYIDIRTSMQLSWNNQSPFCPPVNLTFDDSLGDREWYINPIRYAKMEGRNVDCWGSEGA
jgi:hypothetical protein